MSANRRVLGRRVLGSNEWVRPQVPWSRRGLRELIGMRNEEWQDRAACKGAPSVWFFRESRDRYPPTEALELCNTCPVRSACLDEALRRRDPWGVWGGTTGWQRVQILRGRSRRRCLMCRSDNIRRGPDTEVCMSCGTQWSVPTR